MTALNVVLAVYAALALVYWVRQLHGVIRVRRAMPRLDELAPPPPPAWPKLSVVVAACNEADEIEAAVRTLLAQDYPDLEIVLVDDRSTDATGEILDRLAAEDPRARAIHVTELPDGWLGKVNALATGVRASAGEFVLLTDADVHFHPSTLRRAVAHVVDRRLDHLAALPSLWPSTRLTEAVIGAFIRQFLVATRPWKVADAASRAYLGIGAFNLVRRSAFDATDGFAWLRMETADDMGLGLLMKRSGARCGVVNAFGLVGLHWYRSVAEALRGSEKAYASASRCSLGRTLVLAGLGGLFETAPLATLVPLAFEPLRTVGLAGLGVFGLFVASAVLLARWAGVRMLPPLLSPVVAPLNAAAFVRAGLLGWRRGGVLWRGTLYPSEALRLGNRVRFP